MQIGSNGIEDFSGKIIRMCVVGGGMRRKDERIGERRGKKSRKEGRGMEQRKEEERKGKSREGKGRRITFGF